MTWTTRHEDRRPPTIRALVRDGTQRAVSWIGGEDYRLPALVDLATATTWWEIAGPALILGCEVGSAIHAASRVRRTR